VCVEFSYISRKQLENKRNAMAVKYASGIIIILFLIIIVGCNTENVTDKISFLDSRKVLQDESSKDELTVASSEPVLPATMDLGEKLNFEIVYDLKSVDRAAIWVRPFVNGQRAGGYHAHHLIAVEKDADNPGVVTGWFFFNKPAQIDEIRVYMRDLKTGDTVKEIS
jgi:hypothetical protein